MEVDKGTKSKETIDEGKAGKHAESILVLTKQFTVLELVEESGCLELEVFENMKALPRKTWRIKVGTTGSKENMGEYELRGNRLYETDRKEVRVDKNKGIECTYIVGKVASSHEKSVVTEVMGAMGSDRYLCNANGGKELMKGQQMGKDINRRQHDTRLSELQTIMHGISVGNKCMHKLYGQRLIWRNWIN
ncbi:unnamed protein product [Dovyalis caffra]|uniref:Uncharacterized protein n=1 Tax=Dovyalis caffra TaxID=77055 RepID=A0AAV1REP6_9ROSI|nr:unnamed protein product [Dovyalis caffra]